MTFSRLEDTIAVGSVALADVAECSSLCVEFAGAPLLISTVSRAALETAASELLEGIITSPDDVVIEVSVEWTAVITGG